MSSDDIKEQALANFDVLLEYWNLQYRKISEHEYDIIASWRTDNNFGSVRFNLEKARGADFAGGHLDEQDYARLGLGFSREDFNGFSGQGQSKIGFDIVGLCQRIHSESDYKKAIRLLSRDLAEVSKDNKLLVPARDAALRREREQKLKEAKVKSIAKDIWESSKYHNFAGSVGEKYLIKRGIRVKEDNIRVNPNIRYIDKKNYPALLFKVQEQPDSPIAAIHRIYLSPDGSKAKIDNPKMALAPIKGMGIWFGKRSKTLALTEGPENALTLRELGYPFVVSSIFGTNLHNIKIPLYVRKLIIFPDPDEPGLQAFDRAKNVYGNLSIEVEGYLLPPGNLDLNDYLVRGTENG